MPKEHDDLIQVANAETSIEGALEKVLLEMAVRWNNVAKANDYGKGAAMSAHLMGDMPEVITSILAHTEVFKPEPVVEESRGSRLTTTPRRAERPLVQEDGETDEEFEARVERAEAAKQQADQAPKRNPGYQRRPEYTQGTDESDEDFDKRVNRSQRA